MATFKEDLLADRDEILLNANELAEEILYTKKNDPDNPITMNAVINRSIYKQDFSDSGEYLVKRSSLLISSDPATGVELPNPSGDTITFDGLEWAVSEFEPMKLMGTIRVHVVRRELINKRVRF